MAGSDIIVIGGSAGALDPLLEIVKQMPRSIDAAFFVALHTAPSSEGFLPKILERHGIVSATFPHDGDPIEYGKIYVAPPDQHLELEADRVRLLHGPRENGFRPAIDPLFRSAAKTYGGRVIGVLLSGAMDDGTFGLMSIKQRGGLAIVQHPYEATMPVLPMNAIQNVEVDHIVRARAIGTLILKQAGRRQSENRSVRPDVAASVETSPLALSVAASHQQAESAAGESDRDITLATVPPDKLPDPPSLYVCPECGGALFEVTEQGQFRFRCHTGHGFTPQTLLAQQGVEYEHALWSAVRVLQERAALHRRMSEQAEYRNIPTQARRSAQLAHELEEKADVLRRLLERVDRQG